MSDTIRAIEKEYSECEKDLKEAEFLVSDDYDVFFTLIHQIVKKVLQNTSFSFFHSLK